MQRFPSIRSTYFPGMRLTNFTFCPCACGKNSVVLPLRAIEGMVGCCLWPTITENMIPVDLTL